MSSGVGSKALRLHHRHQAAHSLFSAGAKRRHDLVIADAGSKGVVRHLKFSRINAEAAERAARTQATQTILKCLLNAERFDRNIRATARLGFFTSATTSHCFGSSTTSAPIRFDIFIRTGSLSTPMMNDAPINFAPAVAQSPIGPCAKTTTVSPISMFADSAPLNPVERDIGEQHNLFVAQFVRNFCKVRLRIWHEQIFGLRAVDRVAEAPAADRFDAFAVAALRPLRRQTGATLPAGRDRADENPIANLVSGYAFAEFFDDAYRLVTDNETWLHCILAAQNMNVGATNGGESDLNDRFARARVGRGTSSILMLLGE